CLFALSWCGERDNTAHPRIRPLSDSLDDPALPCCVTPLEDGHDLQALRSDVLLHDHEFSLELEQLLLELLATEVLALPPTRRDDLAGDRGAFRRRVTRVPNCVAAGRLSLCHGLSPPR